MTPFWSRTRFRTDGRSLLGFASALRWASDEPPQGSEERQGKDDGMALSYTARRRWALVILLVGMPAYVVAAVTLVGLIQRPSVLIELGIYVGLGLVWALPFRFIFRGIGQADPDAKVDGSDPST